MQWIYRTNVIDPITTAAANACRRKVTIEEFGLGQRSVDDQINWLKSTFDQLHEQPSKNGPYVRHFSPTDTLYYRNTASALSCKVGALTILPDDHPLSLSKAGNQAIRYTLQDGLKNLATRFSDPKSAKSFLKQVRLPHDPRYSPLSLFGIYNAITQKGWKSTDGDELALPGFGQKEVRHFVNSFEAAFFNPGHTDRAAQLFGQACWTMDLLHIRYDMHRAVWENTKRWNRIQLADEQERLVAVSKLGELALAPCSPDQPFGSSHVKSTAELIPDVASFEQIGSERIDCPRLVTAAEDQLLLQALGALDEVRESCVTLGLSVPAKTFTHLAHGAAKDEWKEVDWTEAAVHAGGKSVSHSRDSVASCARSRLCGP